ncbi:adenylyltransferase [Candidatus Geothermarchaeota archaeon ex4572_27]|nr:MAG: adenylyltransferase [Candidatus Geothermarchaeota archaeon ex4572_27]
MPSAWEERYDRQIRVWGREGQARLKRASVLVAGVGGLGSAAALYLVAAGVGRVVLVDPERVELSNLNRQVLYWTRDVGKLKVECAAEKLRELNPEVKVEAVPERITEDNVRDLVSSVDLVVDGMDNWGTRLLLNRACVELGKPFVHAGVYEAQGQLLTVIPRKGPCLQCVFPEPPPEVRPFPVVGTAPGVLATLQATEALKILAGYGTASVGKLIVFDGYDLSFYVVAVKRRPDCPVCGG